MDKLGEEGGASLLLCFFTSSDDGLAAMTRRMCVARRLAHIGEVFVTHQRSPCHSQGDEARDADGVERHRSCAPPELEIAPANSATHVCLPWTTAAGAAPKQPPPPSRYGALHTASALWCRVNHGFGVSVGVRVLKSTEIRQECMSAGRRPAAGK